MPRILAIILLISLFYIDLSADDLEDKKVTLSGYITDAANGESLPGATIVVDDLKIGTTTNNYGFYSISVIPGSYNVSYSFIGYATKKLTIDLSRDQSINIELSATAQELNEVVVSDEAPNANVTKVQMSVNKISSKTIQEIPALLGEVDLIKALQLLPGVKFVAEGATGLSVRGGGPDQNLILLDEATVYNAGHLLGFFSVFNNDAVKSVELFKGDLPAEYGGRLSSLIDVRMKDGNSKEFHGNGGVGLISSRLMLEGPIVNNKASFMVAGRRSYADIFLRLSNDENIRTNILYFYDLNTKVNYTINDRNHIFVSGYFGKDVFKNGNFGMNWGNSTGTIRWNRIIHEKLFSNFTFIASRFNYNLGIPKENDNAFNWGSALTDYSLKGDFTWYLNSENTIRFGVSSIYHDFFPGLIEGYDEDSFITNYSLPNNYALESAFYLGNEQKLGSTFMLKYGLRFSMFNNVGPGTIFTYDDSGSPIDSTAYANGNFYNTYTNIEPRIGMVYLLNEESSVKISYSRNVQYIQQAQNSTAGSPFNIWFPASPNIKPQKADQYALGYFRNFNESMYETSLEVYYKNIIDAVDFRDHADLLLNKYIEGEVLVGKGWSYGAELMVRKTRGKLTGWLSYTYSRALRKIPGINNNETYSATYDRPNDISLVANYQLNERISIGGTWVYATGQPVTFPVGRYYYNNSVVPVYTVRNSYRFPDYHRLDLSFTYRFLPKEGKKWRSEINISMYNAYNRKNPFTIAFTSDPLEPEVTYAEMTYLFGIIPSITYNFKF